MDSPSWCKCVLFIGIKFPFPICEARLSVRQLFGGISFGGAASLVWGVRSDGLRQSQNDFRANGSIFLFIFAVSFGVGQLKNDIWLSREANANYIIDSTYSFSSGVLETLHMAILNVLLLTNFEFWSLLVFPLWKLCFPLRSLPGTLWILEAYGSNIGELRVNSWLWVWAQ